MASYYCSDACSQIQNGWGRASIVPYEPSSADPAAVPNNTVYLSIVEVETPDPDTGIKPDIGAVLNAYIALGFISFVFPDKVNMEMRTTANLPSNATLQFGVDNTIEYKIKNDNIGFSVLGAISNGLNALITSGIIYIPKNTYYITTPSSTAPYWTEGDLINITYTAFPNNSTSLITYSYNTTVRGVQLIGTGLNYRTVVTDSFPFDIDHNNVSIVLSGSAVVSGNYYINSSGELFLCVVSGTLPSTPTPASPTAYLVYYAPQVKVSKLTPKENVRLLGKNTVIRNGFTFLQPIIQFRYARKCIADGFVFQNCHCSSTGGAIINDSVTDKDQFSNMVFENCGDALTMAGGEGNTLPRWTTATFYAAGTYIRNVNTIYYATTTGTSGGTAPTHTTGTASDGGVTWGVVRNNLLPIWQSGIAVTTSHFYQNGPYVYKALSSAVTGITPPTHTSGDKSDGSVFWAFVREIPKVFNPGQYYAAGELVSTRTYIPGNNFDYPRIYRVTSGGVATSTQPTSIDANYTTVAGASFVYWGPHETSVATIVTEYASNFNQINVEELLNWGFGPVHRSGYRIYVNNFRSSYATVRGFKIMQSVLSQLNNLLIMNAGSTSLAVSSGARYNQFSNVHIRGNNGDYISRDYQGAALQYQTSNRIGIWTDDTKSMWNTFINTIIEETNMVYGIEQFATDDYNAFIGGSLDDTKVSNASNSVFHQYWDTNTATFKI